MFPYDQAGGEGMYKASDTAAHGQLLPQSVFASVGPIADQFGPGIGQESPEDIAVTYPRLRVVGARLDPCFPAIGGANCRHQVRFVMQPVTPSEGFDDAALHVFYDLPEADFDALVSELAALKSAAGKSTDGPLDVHPILKQEGPSGAFAMGLKEKLFARIGADRITRVTAMQLVQAGGTWEFRGFDFVNGTATPIGISGTNSLKQTIHNFGNVGFDATVDPIIATDPDLSLFWSASSASSADAAAKQSAFDATLTIESPNLRDVEHVSCVACHTATPARVWAQNNLGLTSEGNASLFTSTYDLTLTVGSSIATDTTRLRAFGYRGTDVMLSQRVVNESAKVASALSTPTP
ncbi:MAG: hypothetical protein U0165_08620 [Polyangiaceae bacterium]